MRPRGSLGDLLDRKQLAGGLVWQFEARYHRNDRQKRREEKNPKRARNAA